MQRNNPNADLIVIKDQLIDIFGLPKEFLYPNTFVWKFKIKPLGRSRKKCLIKLNNKNLIIKKGSNGGGFYFGRVKRKYKIKKLIKQNLQKKIDKFLLK